jgi:ATP-dependent RNA helicase DeaD
MENFNNLGLNRELLRAVEELGYTEPTAIQAQAVPVLLAGSDLLGQAQTGTGKTAAFALPLLNMIDPKNKTVQALIMAPTRELANQVCDAISNFGKYTGISAIAVYGGSPYGRQISALRSGVQVVVGTPGRLQDLIDKKALILKDVKFLVLDEADEMLEMGFLDEVEAIIKETPDTRQTALFSATLPKIIRTIASKYMRTPQEIAIDKKNITVENIEQRYYPVQESDKIFLLIRLLEMEGVSSALIFTRTKVRASELADALQSRNYPAEALHGDLRQEVREKVLGRFRNGSVNILVATDVAARGLDINDVSHVFNFDLPMDCEDYVHRIGRTGRAGKTGVAVSFVTYREQRKMRDIESFTKRTVARAVVPSAEAILKRRNEQFIEKIVTRLALEETRQAADMVKEIVGYGYTPEQIACAALQIVHEMEKRPALDEIRAMEAQPARPAYNRNEADRSKERRPRAARVDGHEPGMVRLSINRGKSHSISPSSIVGAIANSAGIPGSAIGAIKIHDQRTFLDVSEEYVEIVVRKMSNWKINKKPVTIEWAGAAN